MTHNQQNQSAADISSVTSSSSVSASPISEDIWNKFDNFLLTPPQSPPVNFDLSLLDTMDESLAAALDDLLEDATSLSDFNLLEVINAFQADEDTMEDDVIHDCMWSANSVEDCGHSSADANCTKSTLGVCSTPILSNSCQTSPQNIMKTTQESQLLSTCPMVMGGFYSSFPEMLTCQNGVSEDVEEDDVENIENDEDSQESCYVPMDVDVKRKLCSQSSLESTSSGFVSGSDSLIDHSYDSPKSNSNLKSLFKFPKTTSGKFLLCHL